MPFLLKMHGFCMLIPDFCCTFAPAMRNLPIVTKSLLMANIVFWLLDILLQRYGVQLYTLLGLHYVTASGFHWWQPLTYMFMHGGFSHLFFNMFAVLMFGPVLENEWGVKRYLIYYIICGLGAAAVQEAVWAIKIQSLLTEYTAESVMLNYANQVVTIGASGAVFGILLAFGWLFPNVPMYIFFIPIPIKAKYLVIIYAVIELFAGFSHIQGDNVAHFAHLGGMLFGLLLILWWNRDKLHMPKFLSKFRKVEDAKEKDYSDYHYHRKL